MQNRSKLLAPPVSAVPAGNKSAADGSFGAATETAVKNFQSANGLTADGKAGHSTLPDADQRPHRGANLPRQWAKEKVVTAKTAPRDIRGVTQSQRQLRTATNEAVHNMAFQAQVQTRTHQVQLAIRKAAANTRKTVATVHSAIRHFLASLHNLVVVITAGVSVALSIILVISLVAFVSGSAYGIFFAANAPNENAVTVQKTVEALTGEYRNRLEEISNTIQHDRQDIV